MRKEKYKKKQKKKVTEKQNKKAKKKMSVPFINFPDWPDRLQVEQPEFGVHELCMNHSMQMIYNYILEIFLGMRNIHATFMGSNKQ